MRVTLTVRCRCLGCGGARHRAVTRGGRVLLTDGSPPGARYVVEAVEACECGERRVKVGTVKQGQRIKAGERSSSRPTGAR